MHWTYEPVSPANDLEQGDILEPSADLKNLFSTVHPHFTDTKYRGFLILTQTCDLARREEKGNKCGATHISLSVIRSLQDIICDSLKDQFGYLAPGIYAQHKQRSVGMLIERLVNQNEIALGLFYMHPDADAGITVPSVSILRVAISVRAMEHYQTLQKARVGKLSKEFQPKLGWMVGNLYSRVGVRDWKEETANKEAMIINDILRFEREEPLWINNKIYKKIVKKNPDFLEMEINDQEKVIKDSLPPPPKDKAIEIITKTIKNVASKIPDDALDKIAKRLNNDEQFEAQMRKFGKSN